MIEPSVILKFRKNYDEVLKLLKPKEDFPVLSSQEKNFLTFLSSFFTPAKRVHEMIILKEILEKDFVTSCNIEKILEEKYQLKNQETNIENSFKHLAKEIFTSLSTMKEFEPIILKNGNGYEISKEFKASYRDKNYFKNLIDDLIKYNLAYAEKNYKQTGEETILKYKEYTKQEAFWNLNLDFNNGYQVSGYTVFEEEGKVIVFITLDDSSSFTSYDNKFLDERKFIWFSKTNRYLSRKGIDTIEGKIKKNIYVMEIFVKKELGENFYYFGEVEKVLEAEEIVNSDKKPLVKYELLLKNEIKKELFDYMIK